jgi:hypothetical protein
MRILIFALFVLIIHNISAQPNKVYIVKAGEIPDAVIPTEAKYVFPLFKQGTVYLRDGTFSNQKLNYNVMLNEMQFIGTNGDTLSIAEPVLIKNIIIDTTVYQYDKTYLQVLLEIDSYKLASKEIMIQSPYRTRGGYNVPTATSAITTFGNIASARGNARLQINKDVQFEKETSFFISNKFNRFYKADKKAFLNIFDDRKSNLQKYLIDNNIDYQKKEDLVKLLRFCVSN